MKYHEGERLTLYHGDNGEVMRELPNDSVDSIVCDPPYELGFMGKKWDASGIAYSVDMWQEALRVLKPGAHLLAFSGSRTYHRMTVAIEDAGFEIRDQIMWIYGSGFPKSLDISKAIDKAAGAEREVVGTREVWGRGVDRFQDIGEEIPVNGNTGISITAPATDEARQWQGWGTALKPAHEPIVVARKPLISTVAANVLTYGTGGLNIDATRIVSDDWDEKTVLGKYRGNNESNDSVTGNFGVKEIKSTNTESTLIGRWPANVIHDGSDEVVALFPDTKSGVAIRSKSGGKNFGSDTDKPPLDDLGYGDSGSAARFFYCAKASKKDRNEGLEGFEEQIAGGMQGRQDGSMGSITRNRNHHPTVKPTDLMRYLCRLVTPPDGTVLDPFMGSGSTGKACVLEGFRFIGIEMTDEYLPIAKARIDWATRQADDDLFGGAV